MLHFLQLQKFRATSAILLTSIERLKFFSPTQIFEASRWPELRFGVFFDLLLNRRTEKEIIFVLYCCYKEAEFC